MIEKLIGLLRHTVRYLEESASPMSPHTVLGEPEEQPSANGQAAPATTQVVRTQLTLLWQRVVGDLRSHLHWLWGHPWVIEVAIGLAIAIVVAERWLIQAWEWLFSQTHLLWPHLASHLVALIGAGIVLFSLCFGLQWLHYIKDFVVWVLCSILKRPWRSAFVGGILLVIGFWVAGNCNTWVVLPFKVGQVETKSLSGEKVAAQLISELNQLGASTSLQSLILREPQEPHTSSGSVTLRRNLPLKECQVVLQGPGNFMALERIVFPEVAAGSLEESRLDLGNLSIGTINIPFPLFTQFIPQILPLGYREFNGQISENNGEMEITVSSRNPSDAWSVAGPSDAFSEMIEFLALRMALDLNPELIESSGLERPLYSFEVAFAMGNEAFLQQRYRRAWAFFKLADRFEPLNAKINAMLGLTYYHLALQKPDDYSSHLNSALQAMKIAVRKDPTGDRSILRPYLACLYNEAGLETQAEGERKRFNEYLSRLARLGRDIRIEALRQLPLRGPGRHISVVGGDILFVDDAGDIRRLIRQTGEVTTTLKLSDKNPRQIGTYGDSNLLFITPDGAVRTYAYQATDEKPETLIEGRELEGVQQIATSADQDGHTNLFFLNRFGEIYWCDPNASGLWSAGVCPPQLGKPLVAEPTDVRQIFPVEDRLYILAVDGAVWYTEVDVFGQASPPRPVTPSAQVQEIFIASDETLYLLHDNGDVWRYYDDGRAETEDLKLIYEGAGTAQIFVAGGHLYLLKSDGAVWRISNPRNPYPDDDFTKIEISVPPENVIILEDATIQEIFVIAENLEGDDASSDRTVYLLTDQRVLLQGTDTGSAQMALSSIYIPVDLQTSASQQLSFSK